MTVATAAPPALRYTEAAYELRQDGEWLPIEDSGGVIVKADQIAVIEFKKLAGVTCDE